MNSAEDFQQNDLLQEEPNADNQFPPADSNANLSNTPSQSTGAIPKTKAPTKSKSVPKKAVKINNNLEDVSSLNCNLKNNTLVYNGVSNGLTYLDSFKCNSNGSDAPKIATTPVSDVVSTVNIFEDVNQPSNCSTCGTGDHIVQEPSTSLYDGCKFDSLEPRNLNSHVSDVLESVRRAEINIGSSNRENLALDLETSDTSTEDDLLSISDDGCIYTYKGDQMADLPSSFFSLDIPLPEVPEPIDQNRQQSSSPEMDFLEMDFDPGPLGDGDSECGDLQNSESLSSDKVRTDHNKDAQNNKPSSSKDNAAISNEFSLPGPSGTRISSNLNGLNSNKKEMCKGYTSSSSKKDNIVKSENEMNNVMPWSCSISQRTTGSCYYRTSKRFHCQKGELISPNEKYSNDCVKLSKPTYYTVYKSEEEWEKDVGDSAMIWTEHEALLRQFTQIGPSACGATAVLNVLTALRFPIPPVEKLQEYVNTRLRANSSPLTEYLLSRSVAGTTHEDLIEGLHKLSDGKIFARFFHMYPERIVNLDCWLAYWITNGAVPIATLNLQKCVGTIPDAWHHQMIFGVSPKGIFLTNPLECIDSSKLWPQLCSESTLLVKREDVISRWNYRTDLPDLMKIMDVRWRTLNVVGQVANMIHEHRRELRRGFLNTSHIRIPAAYSSGITLAIAVDSNAYSFLRQCPELPLLHPNDVAAALPAFYQC